LLRVVKIKILRTCVTVNCAIITSILRAVCSFLNSFGRFNDTFYTFRDTLGYLWIHWAKLSLKFSVKSCLNAFCVFEIFLNTSKLLESAIYSMHEFIFAKKLWKCKYWDMWLQTITQIASFRKLFWITLCYKFNDALIYVC